MKLKSLLKNKTFLYFILFIAVVNTFGYLMLRQYEAVILFVLVGFLTSYFSNNMIIVLISSIVVTNLFASSRLNINLNEGFKEGNEHETEDEVQGETVDETVDETVGETEAKHFGKKKKENKKEKMTGHKLRPADYPPGGKTSKIDTSGTLEAAYDNLDKLLSSDAINKMSDETQNLAEQQDKLMGNIDRIGPMLSQAKGMLDKLNIMGETQKTLDSKLGIMSDQIKN